jgi:signal transduction histidine kinase
MTKYGKDEVELSKQLEVRKSHLIDSTMKYNEAISRINKTKKQNEYRNTSLVKDVQRIEEKNITIEGLDTLQDVAIKADKDLIYRVVYNLVDNAVKFTDDGGKITFNIKSDSANLTFRVENTGHGIPENELPYVFERFYKVDKSRSTNKDSTGLGLYIVKTIIKKHGGVISVSSVENQFTAFEFTLPIGDRR